MTSGPLSLTTDQVAAFVELARSGSLRLAARSLVISEQGLRSRLLALEQRVGAELYNKARGIRRGSPLTAQGRDFLPHAQAFLERARELGELFRSGDVHREVHVAASQYLVLYVLIDVIRRFHAAYPQTQIRVSVRNEQEIEAALRADPDVALGIAAPHDPSPDLDYLHLFSLSWKAIAPPRHPLLRKKRVRLADLVDQPLILFERGSTGRQHVIDAFHEHGLSPRVEMETTNTEIIVRMVEAGLGVSIVPLLDQRHRHPRPTRRHLRTSRPDSADPLGHPHPPRTNAAGRRARVRPVRACPVAEKTSEE